MWTHEDQVERTMEVLRGPRPRQARARRPQPHELYLRPRFAFELRDALKDADTVDVTQVVDDLRLVKSPARSSTCATPRTSPTSASPPASTRSARASPTTRSGRHPARDLAQRRRVPAYLFLVDARGTLHGTPIGKILRPGDTIYMEVSGVKRRYHRNISRTAIIGEPPAKIKEIYDVAKRALDEATAAMVPGATVGELVALVGELHAG